MFTIIRTALFKLVSQRALQNKAKLFFWYDANRSIILGLAEAKFLSTELMTMDRGLNQSEASILTQPVDK